MVQPLESTSSPLNPLGPGIHVHWELPDFFRRGVQPDLPRPAIKPPEVAARLRKFIGTSE